MRSGVLTLNQYIGFTHLEKIARLMVRDWDRIKEEQDILLLDAYVDSMRVAITCIDGGC